MTDTDRRTFVTGAALAGVAAAVPAAAQNGGAAPAGPVAHPRPPFPVQRQPWPGLASKMTPRPDHGEQSYKGSGRLAGKRALITGGDSGIGRAAAIAYAREGADVAINYLPAEEPDAREVVALIRAAGRKAVAIPGDLRDEGFCRKLVQQAAAQLGGLDILVNNAARQQTRPDIASISSQDFDDTMKTNVYAPFCRLRRRWRSWGRAVCRGGRSGDQLFYGSDCRGDGGRWAAGLRRPFVTPAKAGVHKRRGS